MSLEEQRRAAFERWYLKRFGSSITFPENVFNRDHDGRYYSSNVYAAFCAWNDALDSVEIELPAKWDHILDGRGQGMCAEAEARDAAIDECRAYLEASGLKVKQ